MQSKIQQNAFAIYLEILIVLIFCLVLPVVMIQSGLQDMTNSWSFQLRYLGNTIVRLLYVLYILSINRLAKTAGIIKPEPKDIWYSIIAFLGVWIILYLLNILFSYFPWPSSPVFDSPDWDMQTPALLPLLLIGSLLTGYFEEALFRCYLYTRLRTTGNSIRTAVLLTSLLFSLGHLYQGIVSALMIFAMGLFFQLFFVYRRTSIHPIAIAHGIYNAGIFLLLARDYGLFF